MRAVALVLLLGLVGACGQSAVARPTISPTPAPIALPSQSPSPSPTPTHVFVIVMENRGYDQAIAGGYIAQLAATYAAATDYHGVSHPSLPNYLAMTSGDTWGITDDGYHPLPAGGIGAQLDAANITWRAYMEGMTGTCFQSPSPYALKHNPFPYYGNTCPPPVVPFTQFDSDMAGDVPRFVWITPDLCHDGHDCPTAVADQWLSQTVPKILATSAWQQNGLLLITWDEGEDSANHVLTLVIQPNPVVHSSSHRYDHYSLLASIEDRLGVPRLAHAAEADAMNDIVTPTTR